MILQQQIAGDVWLVHDGNSGGHVTREHPRSIAGYTIVDPGSAAGGPGFAGGGPGFAGVAQSAPADASAYGWGNAYALKSGRTLVASTNWHTVSKLRRRH
jgi:hypothetical protein